LAKPSRIISAASRSAPVSAAWRSPWPENHTAASSRPAEDLCAQIRRRRTRGACQRDAIRLMLRAEEQPRCHPRARPPSKRWPDRTSRALSAGADAPSAD
jgi:hypothetical protein